MLSRRQLLARSGAAGAAAVLAPQTVVDEAGGQTSIVGT
jgi:hypothetical protein